MASQSHKWIVDVYRTDENGVKITHTFRLPTLDDWQKNVIALNKKIIKKFDIQHEYALCINKNTISHNDHNALSDIIRQSDETNIPIIEIVASATNTSQKSESIRKIQIHSNHNQFPCSLPFDLRESDDKFYTQLITDIKEQFGITSVDTFKLYEQCDEKRIDISDWEDLYESLQATKLCDTLHLYVDITSHKKTEDKEYEHDTPHHDVYIPSGHASATQLNPPSIYQSQSHSHINDNQVLSDRTDKLVLLGDSTVGKSSIEQRFVCNKFSETKATVGALFSRQTVDYRKYRLTFEIWDTAGQERFKSLTSLYYRNASAALIVYDITNYESFVSALRWIKELHEYDEEIVVALCGNKLDLCAQRKVSYQEVKEWVMHNNIAVFGETSAKTNVNITQMFRQIGEVIAKTAVIKENVNGIQVQEDGGQDPYVAYANCLSYCHIL
eukprot:166072_1